MTELTLRDHARAGVRSEALRCAWRLFAAQGYDATTVEQVAEAAGMSRRTFFRYFESKDELVAARMQESNAEIVAALAARPHDEPVWLALRRAFELSVALSEEHAGTARPLQRMLETETSLRGLLEQSKQHWVATLAPAVAARLGAPAGDRGAEALAASALACLDVARRAWAVEDRAALGALLDETMGAVAPLGV